MMNIRTIYLFLRSNIEAREAFDKQLKAGELVDVAAIAKKAYAQQIAETKATIEKCEQGMIHAAPNYRRRLTEDRADAVRYLGELKQCANF